MIFSPEMAKLVLSGRKTMTRRPVKAAESKCRYREGRVYAIQPGRGKPGAGPITILDVRQEQLGDITLPDVKREGFRTTEEFVAYWSKLYSGHDPSVLVWVISFAKGDVTDRPRLLAARSGGPGGDYTDIPARAMRGEMEAVPARVQERFSREGEERDRERLKDRRSRLGSTIADIRAAAEGLSRTELSPLARKKLRSAVHHLTDVEADVLSTDEAA